MIRALVAVVVLSVAAVIAGFVLEAAILYALVPVVVLGVALPAIYMAHVAFTKERYEIHDDHLVAHHGTLLSDGRTELDVHNITHVRLRLPFLRHRLWGIGDVRVESAGSAASEITMESIVGPEAMFQRVQDLMRANGYALQKGTVLHEESPGVVGALTHIAQVGLGGGVSLVVVVLTAGGVLGDLGTTGGSLLSLAALAIGGAVGVVGMIAGLVVRYLDMTRRTYTVYDDAVAYTEGFLTRDNAIIPFENIADASTNRTFIDQMVGLYDVKVSCQGSGSEITFRRLSNGPALEKAIGELVASASKKSRQRAARKEPEPESEPESQPMGRKRVAPKPKSLVDPDEAWTAQLQMNPVRAQMSLVPLMLVFPAWMIAAVGMFIRSTRTTFTVGPNSMSSSYAFVGSNQQEFAYDKVTGVQIDRSPFDALFGTLSVQIWSIGSSKPLAMPFVAESDLNLPALLRQCGVNAEDPPQGELAQSFGPRVWAVQNVFSLVAIALMIGIALVAVLFVGPVTLLAVPVLAALPLPMAIATSVRVKRQRVTFHAEHVEARTGIFLRKHIYARYDNVKKVQSTRIPFTDQGRFKLFIAGERLQQQGNTAINVPYSLEGAYIEGISLKTDAMDALMLGLIEPSEITGSHAQDDDVVRVAKPAVANSVVPLGLLGLLFPPLWLFVPIVVLQVRARSYAVETDRVVERGGILFRYATSVLFDRIDSLQQHQGALGKAFGNGRITILTAGSSAPDLTIANVGDHQVVYDTIRKHYGRSAG